MIDHKALQEELKHLNPKQCEAVEQMDGPVLVIAGPGTGKTQLLSLRVANILDQCDVRPENILCLTYTNAGVDAMVKRLTGFLGRDAYAVNVSTFHAFAQGVRQDYPQYFAEDAMDSQATPFQMDRWFNNAILSLPFDNCIAGTDQTGTKARSLQDAKNFVADFQTAGISTNDFTNIIQQNLDFFDYVQQETDIIDRLYNVPGASEAKTEYLDALQEEIVLYAFPPSLTRRVIKTSDVYTPYALHFKERMAVQLYNTNPDTGRIKTEGLQAVRKSLFSDDKRPDGTKAHVFKDRKICEKLLEYAKLYDSYRAAMKQNALYDFNDMISQTVQAVSQNDDLKAQLQSRYTYILVDEFQDTNPAQMQMVQLLGDYTDAPNIMAVGDDDQSIMRFQGASVEYIGQFRDSYPRIHEVVLQDNYRSTTDIVAAGKFVGDQVQTRIAQKDLNAKRGDVAALDTIARQYTSKDIQYYSVAKDIADKIAAGFFNECVELNRDARTGKANDGRKGSEIAVLARGNKQLQEFIPYLEAQGVPYNYKYQTLIENVDSLQTLFACMRFASAYACGDFALADSYLPQILSSREFAWKFNIAPDDYFTFAVEAKSAKRSYDAQDARALWLELLPKCDNALLKAAFDSLQLAAMHAQSEPATRVIYELAAPLRAYYEAGGADAAADVADAADASCGAAATASRTVNRDAIEFNYGLKALLDFVSEQQKAYAPGFIQDADGKPYSAFAQRFTTLPKVVELLDEAVKLGQKIDFQVNIAREGAITLSTAHSSKGLEWDLVYIIDADKKSWTPKNFGDVLAQNMLFGKSSGDKTADEDDERRLMFVALTRARTYLQVSFAGANMAPQLLGDNPDAPLFRPEPQNVNEDDVVCGSNTCWQDAWTVNETSTPILSPVVANMTISATSLNDFVEYDGKNADTIAKTHDKRDFVARKMFSLPEAPALPLEFGSVLHDFLENEQKYVLSDKIAESDLVARAHNKIDNLDFTQNDIKDMHARFDAMLSTFLPKWKDKLQGGDDDATASDTNTEAAATATGAVVGDEPATGIATAAGMEVLSERWIRAYLPCDGTSDITLVGKCDLLMLDRQDKSIVVYDYKSGNRKTTADVRKSHNDLGYVRQLEFYKLAIENSADPMFAGMHVTGAADVYIEPQVKEGGALISPRVSSISADHIKHLEALIRAVWWRIQSGELDTSAFETSQLLSDAKNNADKKLQKEDLQRLYEQWLIDSTPAD